MLRCFAGQTHPEKELIFIVDTVAEADALINTTGRPEKVTTIIAGATLGDKRNAGCEFARGQIIAHFDDDDLYAPGHLAHLAEAIADSGNAVAGYTSTVMREMRRVTVGGRKTSGWWTLRSDTLLGGALAYRRDWWMDHPFESVNVGEDNSFIAAAQKSGQAIDAGSGHLYYCLRNHAGNVSGRVVIEGPDCVELSGSAGFDA